jgi:hypothetical protein
VNEAENDRGPEGQEPEFQTLPPVVPEKFPPVEKVEKLRATDITPTDQQEVIARLVAHKLGGEPVDRSMLTPAQVEHLDAALAHIKRYVQLVEEGPLRDRFGPLVAFMAPTHVLLYEWVEGLRRNL